jgi:D-3-phosphoglycerate dehydrogenase
MFRIWFERPLPPIYLPLLAGVAEVAGCAADTPETPFNALERVDAIIAGSRLSFDAALMDRVSGLRVISRSGIGVDNVDIMAATARRIAVCNTPDGPTISTAEHTIMLLLATAKHLRKSECNLRAARTKDFFSNHTGTEIRGRQLGLIGLGRIGREVAAMALGLGMKVAGYDPFVTGQQAAQLGIEAMSSLEDLLRHSDFVSLHLPLIAQTRHLINDNTLSLMKPGSYLINCARGPLVDETALLKALESGHLAGAGLDVFEKEPPPPDHPLLKREDVVVTPHIGSATGAGKDRMWRAAIAQALQVLRGERPQFLVNPDVWPI